LIESLPSKHEALSSNPITAKERKKERKKEKASMGVNTVMPTLGRQRQEDYQFRVP
jgi:hypothetical protein